jgi:hypothetical protein
LDVRFGWFSPLMVFVSRTIFVINKELSLASIKKKLLPDGLLPQSGHGEYVASFARVV